MIKYEKEQQHKVDDVIYIGLFSITPIDVSTEQNSKHDKIRNDEIEDENDERHDKNRNSDHNINDKKRNDENINDKKRNDDNINDKNTSDKDDNKN